MTKHRVTLQFDRGTLLVAGKHVDRLPGVLWDPRVAAYRAPAYRYQELAPGAAELAEGMSRPLQIREPDLRPYQQAALEAWEVTGRRGVVVLPTGSGKTHVALAAMARRGCSTLVLVPTRPLLTQWVRHMEGFTQLPVGVIGDGSRTVELLTVCTFDSAYGQMDHLGAEFGLLVVDEVHQLGTRLRPEALEMCAAPTRLGLTATPPAVSGARVRMEQLVGPVVSKHTASELGRGHLAPYRQVPIYVELTHDERKCYEDGYMAYLAALEQFCRVGRAAPTFERFAIATSVGRQGLLGLQTARRAVAMAQAKVEVARTLLERHELDRSLVFTADNTAAYSLSRALLIPALTCDIGRPERLEILERLRKGRYRAVVSARVLNEGLDLPDCRIGVMLAASQGGVREHIQRLGRLLRPAPNKQAALYEVLANGTFEVEHARRREVERISP